MSKKSERSPRSLCKSLTQMMHIAKNAYYNSNRTYDENVDLYQFRCKMFDIRRRLILEYNLDINNDFREKNDNTEEKR